MRALGDEVAGKLPSNLGDQTDVLNAIVPLDRMNALNVGRPTLASPAARLDHGAEARFNEILAASVSNDPTC